MASDEIEAIADKGYYKGEEIVACEEAGIAVTVPKPHTSNAAAMAASTAPTSSTSPTRMPTSARPASG